MDEEDPNPLARSVEEEAERSGRGVEGWENVGRSVTRTKGYLVVVVVGGVGFVFDFDFDKRV